jgi:hypothetical protein
MTIDQPREGRQLPGAKTSEDERAGIEEILIELLDGAVELQHAAAPAGDVRIVVMNRGSTAFGLTVHKATESRSSNPGSQRSAAADWSRIEPGGSEDALVHLEDGDYTIEATDLEQARVVSTATLVVQPQQGLPGSGEFVGRRG